METDNLILRCTTKKFKTLFHLCFLTCFLAAAKQDNDDNINILSVLYFIHYKIEIQQHEYISGVYFIEF